MTVYVRASGTGLEITPKHGSLMTDASESVCLSGRALNSLMLESPGASLSSRLCGENNDFNCHLPGSPRFYRRWKPRALGA